jgi:hypothetical protein
VMIIGTPRGRIEDGRGRCKFRIHGQENKGVRY